MPLTRLIRFLFVFTIVGFSIPDPCYADPVSILAEDPGWLALGHYEKSFLGRYRSRVTYPTFFLSPDGATDPEKELRATLQAFRGSDTRKVGSTLKQPAICAFPARLEWIKRKGLLPELSDHPPCLAQTEWRNGLSTKSVTLVYSSAYPNNPASMFGHTLLRLNRAGSDPLLSYGANFEARLDSKDSALVFAFKGLFGLYDGEFTIAPYYVKVNEYSFSESRDLWEYELNLKPEEVDRLVSHLWELYSSAGFSYYFLTENCSYQLLALIEAAKPEWPLTRGFNLYALPADTLKRVGEQATAIRSETFRPSLHSKLVEQLSRLNGVQTKAHAAILASEKEAASVEDPSVLESVLTSLDYRRRKSPTKFSKPDEQIFRESLLRRATLGAPSEFSPADRTADSPLLSHDSHVFSIGAMNREENMKGVIGVRAALHDLSDPPAGYPAGLQVDVLNARLSIGKKIQLERLEIFDLLSLYPANEENMQFSWALRAGGDRPLDFGRSDRLAWGLEGGPGVALSFAKGRSWIYGLVLASGELISIADKSGRYGPKLEIGTSQHLHSAFSLFAKIQFATELNHPFNRAVYWNSDVNLSANFSRNLQLRLGGRFSGSFVKEFTSFPEWVSDVRWYF